MQGNELVLKVYVDIVFLVNFGVDFFILWLTGKLTALKKGIARLLLGAFFGALYSLAIFLPGGGTLASGYAKVACSVIMLLLAFAPFSWRVFFKGMALMYLVSFAVGGCVVAFVYLVDNSAYGLQVINGAGILQTGLSYHLLLAGMIVVMVSGWYGVHYINKNQLGRNLLYSLTIAVLQKKVTIKALLDTGNQLSEPFTKKPVVIVEAKYLQDVLPQDVVKALARNDDFFLQAVQEKSAQEWVPRFCMIPYSSVGRENGLLLGIRPDYIEINKGGKRVIKRDVIVGLVGRAINKEGRYQAILHPEVLKQDI